MIEIKTLYIELRSGTRYEHNVPKSFKIKKAINDFMHGMNDTKNGNSVYAVSFQPFDTWK